ncbi:agmatinase family protein [Paenactinomyces guangxiensis]|uniref:Agmatinase family protein n=1 Tax=Paenactinomyces guangxiensis TaxID=1490290 RepID=A0A7W1WV32_9BACL|nr:agmatinase family protein [Paenactinomyces guangxiensis]MBA4496513.1 agmatinase family protein [Paenactinomyces guangxiensis]MBH8593543.1 agmatinase family protein [Paenactinomyces guangxiensis]
MLQPPSFQWNVRDKTNEPKVHEWIQTLDMQSGGPVDWSGIDVTLLGIPLSRSSISASAASENPDAMRRGWKYFTTYNLDEDVDLSVLRVVDLGDVRQHVTDIPTCHRNIMEAMVAMRTHHPNTFPLMIGGDHSITAMLVRGWKQAHPQERIGILQLDTHFDLRSLEDNGPSNGTPIRNLIESGVVKGEDVYNIGLHGFFNAKSLRDYAHQAGLHFTTLKAARRIGIDNVIQDALRQLSRRTDTIYLTVDMDVLDISVGPGAPASTPGGMRTDELFEVVQLAGSCPKVRAMDIVCLDPYQDIARSTIKAGVHVMLSFLTGFVQRKMLQVEGDVE